MKKSTKIAIAGIIVGMQVLYFMGTQFIYRGDFYMGPDDPPHKIIRECNKTHREQLIWARAITSIDITPAMKEIIHMGDSKDSTLALLQQAGFSIQALEHSYRGFDETLLARRDIGFPNGNNTRMCSFLLFIKSNKVELLQAQAVKGAVNSL